MEEPAKSFYFGPFQFDAGQRLLLRDGKPIPLAPKAVSILSILLENRGKLVERDDLMNRVWPNLFVEEGNLTVNIFALRKILDAGCSGGPTIETIPKRGYRFVAPVEEIGGVGSRGGAPSEDAEVGAEPANMDFRLRGNDRPATGTDKELSAGGGEASTEVGEAATAAPAATPAQAGIQDTIPSTRSIPIWVRVASLAALGLLILVATVVRVRVWLKPPAVERAPIRSIAVLPLENLSGDTSQEYFAEGITDDLTTALAQIGSVQVISRTSASHYKGPQQTLPEIGRALNVDGIVEGSVRRVGNQVRITARLIDVRADRDVWAATYEEDITDVLFAQRQIASAIATQVSAQLTVQERERLSHRQPVNPEAYDDFLQGRYFWNQRSADGLQRAAAYFQQAIALDPNYADAYAVLADDYLVMPFYILAPQNDFYPKAKAAAAKALELDPSSAEAHNAMAYALFWFDWDFTDAEREFRRALELNSNLVSAHQWHAEFLSVLGRHEEALAEMRQVLRLDPATPVVYHQLGQTLKSAGQYEAAIEAFRHVLELDPKFQQAAVQMADAYQALGRMEDWARTERVAASIDGNPAYIAATEELIKGTEGHASPQVLLHAISVRDQRPAFFEAKIYAEHGDKVYAFEKLEEAYRRRDSEILSLKIAPEFASLHSDPRYQALAKKIGFPDDAARSH